MNPDVKVKWIAALRSGDYAQTHGTLRDKDGYCCLGVLCDIAAKHGKGTWRLEPTNETQYETQYTFHPVDGGFAFSFLPAQIGRWAGFEDNELTDPIIDPTAKEGQRAVTHNDSIKSTFAHIADLVEKNL